jgi:hypothetical protein
MNPDSSRAIIDDEQGAVAVLLDRCPELELQWAQLCDLMATTDAAAVGIYSVFAQVILPTLEALLRPTVAERFREQYPGVLPGDKHEQEIFLDRLYDVLDEWAVAKDEKVRDAVAMELSEGYGTIESADELLARAGPRLSALIELKRHPPIVVKRSNLP